MLLFGGFLLNNDTMPGAVAWLKHISAFNYGFETLMTNELRGIVLTFNAPGYPSIPIYGDVFLKTMKLYYSNRYYDVLALAVLTFAFQIGAYASLCHQVSVERKRGILKGYIWRLIAKRRSDAIHFVVIDRLQRCKVDALLLCSFGVAWPLNVNESVDVTLERRDYNSASPAVSVIST